MRYLVTVGDREIEVEVSPSGAAIVGGGGEARLEGAGDGVRYLVSGDARHRVAVARVGETWEIVADGRCWSPAVLDERERRLRESAASRGGGASEAVVKAPMPGLVLRLEVREGDPVSKGQGVLVLEAMKMENEIRAPGPGTVLRVLVEAGTAVEKGTALIEIGTDGR